MELQITVKLVDCVTGSRKNRVVYESNHTQDEIRPEFISELAWSKLRPIYPYSKLEWFKMDMAKRSYTKRKMLRNHPILKYKFEYWRKLTKSKPNYKDKMSKMNKKKYAKIQQPGSQTFGDFTGRLYNTIVSNTKQRNDKGRNHEHVEWSSLEEFREYAKTKTEFRLNEIICFPIVWSNGFYNSASMQRWDNRRGYIIENVDPIPICLNTAQAFSKEELLGFTKLICMYSVNEILENTMRLSKLNLNGLFGRLKHRNKDIGFKDGYEFKEFIFQLYTTQAGLCAYSGAIMMVPDYRKRTKVSNNAFIMSFERRNPTLGYIRSNICLICHGFNGRISGPRYKQNEDVDMNVRIFNVKYWNKCMGYTDEILARVNELREVYREEIEKSRLLNNV